MLEEGFEEGNSLFHQADPRAKVICAFFLAFAIALLHTTTAALIALMVSGLSILLARLPLFKVVKRLFVVNTFIAFLWLFLPFSVPGRPIFTIWRWNVTFEGIKFALLITLKCNAILLIIISFVATTPMPLLGFALGSLRLPAKLTLLMLISYRYIDIISKEYSRLLDAAKIRCFTPKTNMHTYRTYAYLVGMLLIRSYERGQRVYQAMLLRGFKGRFYSLQDFRFRTQDIFLIVGTGFWILVLVVMDHFATISLLWGA